MNLEPLGLPPIEPCLGTDLALHGIVGLAAE